MEKDRDARQKFKEELLRDTKISNGEETWKKPRGL